MIHSYYNRQKLQQADDSYLSFGISINLLDSAFNILQHPIDLLKNEKGSYYRNKSISEYELIACFQSVSTALELILKSIGGKTLKRESGDLFYRYSGAVPAAVIRTIIFNIPLPLCLELTILTIFTVVKIMINKGR